MTNRNEKPSVKCTALFDRLLYYVPLTITALSLIACLVIELCHVEISREGRDQIYGTFGSFSLFLSLFLCICYGRKYELNWIRSVLFSAMSFFLVFNLVSTTWADLDIKIFGSGAIASYRSIIFLPILCLILSRFSKQDSMNLCDYLTPYFFFHHGLVTAACWIEGCCAGKPSGWGLLNPLSGMTVFPLQPCIIIMSVAVTYWGLNYAKKHSYRANGMVFANSLIFYGFFRYILELFSDDLRVFGALSWLSVCSLVMLALGFLMRGLIKRQKKRHNDVMEVDSECLNE